VKVPQIKVTKVSGTKQEYHRFFCGQKKFERQATYGLAVANAIGEDTLKNLKEVSGDYGIDYADGNIALRVYSDLVPKSVTEHFYQAAESYSGRMQQCANRHAQSLHLGPKEYNANMIQRGKDENPMPPRVWCQDGAITKEQVQAILPELLMADCILKQVDPEGYKHKKELKHKYRLARTCWTRAAVNSTNCRYHRDRCRGLDLMMYAGSWADGGLIYIPQLGVKIKVKAGDVVIMDSKLFHKVDDFEGIRYVMIFFTKSYVEKSKKNWLYSQSSGRHEMA